MKIRTHGGNIELERLGTEAQELLTGRSFVHAGPPPVAFRETNSGLLQIVHQEIVIRVHLATPEKRRRDLLRRDGFEVRRVNPFFPEQVVVQSRRSRSGEELVEVSSRWADLDEVVFATPNFVSQFLRQGLPEIRSEQWHLRVVDILRAWKTMTGDPRIVVAVLDDGVDLEHPDLQGRFWTNPDPWAKDRVGRDFFVPSGSPEHFNPRPKRFTYPFHVTAGNDIHGTPCAGLVAGIAPGCRILPVKIFHADDLASAENVANAIRYSALHADVLSCSWTSGINPDIQQALADAGTLGRQGRGSAVFCAAGNGRGGSVGFPARDSNAVAVGALTDQAVRASYSNVGPELAFVAPSSGGRRGIFTTDVSLEGRGFNLEGLHTDSFGGTSAATAIATGVAALVLSVNPALSRSELKDLLQKTARKVGGGRYGVRGHSEELGTGRIHAGRAVAEALRSRE